jgi:hypothetical protein
MGLIIAAKLERYTANCNALYDLIKRAEVALAAAHFDEGEIPRNILTQNLLKFLGSSTPLAGPPYPHLCGRRQLPPGRTPGPGQWVCLKVPNATQLILGQVADCDLEGICLVCDEAPNRRGPRSYRVGLDSLLMVPKCLPSEVGTGLDYRPGERVLSLFNGGRSWSTVFYPAVVLKSPRYRGEGYKVRFEGERVKSHRGPERLVVPLSDAFDVGRH